MSHKPVAISFSFYVGVLYGFAFKPSEFSYVVVVKEKQKNKTKQNMLE